LLRSLSSFLDLVMSSAHSSSLSLHDALPIFVSFLYPLTLGACIYTVSPEGVKYINVIETLEKYDLTFAAVAPSLLQLLRPYFPEIQDRKSTRLNSSHVSISYAVFCLKKKIQNK